MTAKHCRQDFTMWNNRSISILLNMCKNPENDQKQRKRKANKMVSVSQHKYFSTRTFGREFIYYLTCSGPPCCDKDKWYAIKNMFSTMKFISLALSARSLTCGKFISSTRFSGSLFAIYTTISVQHTNKKNSKHWIMSICCTNSTIWKFYHLVFKSCNGNIFYFNS